MLEMAHYMKNRALKSKEKKFSIIYYCSNQKLLPFLAHPENQRTGIYCTIFTASRLTKLIVVTEICTQK